MNIAFIQARENSNRLPRKVLRKIHGKPVLQHVVERVSLSRLIDRVVVVTGNSTTNKGIIDLCKKYDYEVFSGDDEDVLLRFIQAIDFLNLNQEDRIIRITADCPLIDSMIIDLAIESHNKSLYKYSNTSLEDFLPDGLDVEIIDIDLLKEINMVALEPSDREHVTKLIYSNDSLYSVNKVRFDHTFPNIRLTLDYEEDFLLIKKVFDILSLDRPKFGLEDIVTLYQNSPEIFELNTKYNRNEGISLSNQNNQFINNNLSRLCLGTANLGMHYGIVNQSGQLSELEFSKILLHAQVVGMKFIDTAFAYGTAENRLGLTLRKTSTSFQIMGKYSGNTYQSDGCLNDPLQEINHSLNQIGIPSFYCYYFHKAEDLYNEEFVIAMKEIKLQGLAKYIGVSVYSAEDAFRAVDHPVIDVIQVRYNVLDQELDRLGFFESANSLNKKVFVRSIFLQGVLLADENSIPEKLINLIPHVRELDVLAKDYALTRRDVLLHYVLSNPSIDGIIVGVDNDSQFNDIIESIKKLKPNLGLHRRLSDRYRNLVLPEVNPITWRQQ